MTVKEFMRNYKAVSKYKWGMMPFGGDGIASIMRPRIVCNDGFSVSVQGSNFHYCTPRENLLDDDYSEVELGYPSVEDDVISDYAEDPRDLTQTVYPFTPIEVVEELVAKHGGISGPDTEMAEKLKSRYISTQYEDRYVTW